MDAGNLADRSHSGRYAHAKRIQTERLAKEDAYDKVFEVLKARIVRSLCPDSLFARVERRMTGRGGAGTRGEGTWYVYMSCILSESETERTLEREPVPERALVRDRSISYLPIKGRRFVQFILNHGTVTGCQ